MGEGLHRTSDLSMRDTSNYVLWEFSVRCKPPVDVHDLPYRLVGGAPSNYFEFWYGEYPGQLLPQEERQGRAYTQGR